MSRIQRDSGKVKKSRGEALRLPTGKVVGRIREGVAIFTVKRSRHYFRAIAGYSLDSAILREVAARGIQRIEFQDKDEARSYRVPVPTFLRHARRINYGFGEKLVCPESFYDSDVPEPFFLGMSSLSYPVSYQGA